MCRVAARDRALTFFSYCETCVLFLQVPRVGQHHRAQIDGRLSGVNGAAEAFFNKPRNPAAMIKMGVRQNDCVDLAAGNRRVFPVALAPFFLPLKQSAVNQDLKALFAARIISVLIRCLEPVTVPAAPRNWMYAKLTSRTNHINLSRRHRRTETRTNLGSQMLQHMNRHPPILSFRAQRGTRCLPRESRSPDTASPI